MSRPLAIFFVVFCCCAHQPIHLYSLGSDLSVEENAQGIYVRDERPSLIWGQEYGPIFFVRPSQANPASGCFEGFFNPHKVQLLSTEAHDNLEPFALCRDPDEPNDASAYRIDVQLSWKRGVQQLAFRAQVKADFAVEVTPESRATGRVRLPQEAGVFRQHPELIGALVALGALPSTPIELKR